MGERQQAICSRRLSGCLEVIYTGALIMTSPTETSSRRAPQDLYWKLYAADRDVGVCLLTFPVSTFFGALLIGLCGSLPAMHPSGAPFWILLGVCVLFSAWAVFAARSARRTFARAEMSLREIQRRISAMWIATACLMILAGSCVLGYLAITFDPHQMRSITVFGTLDRPLPLAITLSLYVMSGALLLGWSWREAREAKNASGVRPGGSQEAGKAAEWTRELELYTASRSGEGVLVFVFATSFLALLIALGHGGGDPTPRLVIMALAALGAGLSVLLVQKSRRHLEAAGLSHEEVRREMASAWRTGAILMIVIGAGALALLILAFDVLTPADRPWSLGTALGYTSIGLLLLWWNRRKRGA